MPSQDATGLPSPSASFWMLFNFSAPGCVYAEIADKKIMKMISFCTRRIIVSLGTARRGAIERLRFFASCRNKHATKFETTSTDRIPFLIDAILYGIERNMLLML